MTAVHGMAGAHARDAHALPPKERATTPSFAVVYERHFGFVWSCARRMGVPADAVDDVVQEIFLVVHSRLNTIERPASLRSWLYGVVRRTVSSFHRSRQARNAREARIFAIDHSSAGSIQPSPLDLAVLTDEVKLLWRLLLQLDPLKREVLVLAELEEMTAPEIAEALGIPLNTAYSRLRIAREEFSGLIARARAREAGSIRTGKQVWRG
jgi:RNA polymerase sigma-70 factor (ECF subfamily)